MMWWRVICLTLLGLFGLTACGTSPLRGAAPGVLTGGIVYHGGPSSAAPSNTHYEPGTVEVRHQGRLVTTQQVSEGNPYRLSLAPGDYDLYVHLGDLTCHRLVRVQSASTTTADLSCSIK